MQALHDPQVINIPCSVQGTPIWMFREGLVALGDQDLATRMGHSNLASAMAYLKWRRLIPMRHTSSRKNSQRADSGENHNLHRRSRTGASFKNQAFLISGALYGFYAPVAKKSDQTCADGVFGLLRSLRPVFHSDEKDIRDSAHANLRTMLSEMTTRKLLYFSTVWRSSATTASPRCGTTSISSEPW